MTMLFATFHATTIFRYCTSTAYRSQAYTAYHSRQVQTTQSVVHLDGEDA